MTSCRRTPAILWPSPLTNEIVNSNHAELPLNWLLSDRVSDPGRPTPLAALLLLAGSGLAHDTALTQSTTSDLALFRATLELLNHTEAASAA